MVADLRGSFTGYGNTFPPPTDGTISSAPVDVDRPDFIGHVDGRLDVTPRHPAAGPGAAARRHRQSRQPEHPGRPAAISDLCDARRHASASTRISTACRFPPAPPSTAPSINTRKLTDGTSTSNDDRNFNQFGGVGRVSYDLMPGLKPFGEIEGNSRVHDLRLDRSGYQRNSSGGYVRAGTSFEFSRLLTGEIAVG